MNIALISSYTFVGLHLIYDLLNFTELMSSEYNVTITDNNKDEYEMCRYVEVTFNSVNKRSCFIYLYFCSQPFFSFVFFMAVMQEGEILVHNPVNKVLIGHSSNKSKLCSSCF